MFSLVNYRKDYIVSVAALLFLLTLTGCDEGQDMLLDLTQPTAGIEIPTEIYTYLALKPATDENTITPINGSEEWGLESYISEKTRDGLKYEFVIDRDPILNQPEPEWIKTDNITPKFDRDFDHWIYSHARSSIIYDLSDRNYAIFDGYISAADIWIDHVGCGHDGSIRFIFSVDNAAVYQSDVIVGIEQKEPVHVQFDIPYNAKTLTITVTDAGDGIGCDHWLLGNPRLLRRAAQDTIPEVTEPPLPEPIYAYLALKPTTDGHTITPINDLGDWGESVIQEKARDGLYYYLGVDDDPVLVKPEYEWIRTNTISNRFDFEYWINSVARSELVYDLSSGRYVEFDGYISARDWNIHDPGCEVGGTVRFLFLLDNETVYKSAVIVGIEQDVPIHVNFEVPATAEKLTIVVTDGGNGNHCDGWTLGDARLVLHKEVETQEHVPQ